MLKSELKYKKNGDRNIVLLRGLPGVGKSTFIKDNNLEGYAISMDDLRLTVLSPIMNTLGVKEIDNTKNREIFHLFMELLETRLSNGVFTVVDNTNIGLDSIRSLIQLSDKYGYNLSIINFEEDLDVVLKRNEMRKNTLKHISLWEDEDGVKLLTSMHNSFTQSNENIKRKYHVIDSKDKDGVSKLLKDTYQDLNQYKEVKVIGDIHGSFSVLNKAIPEIREDTFYVFLGDYVDRGAHNHEVLRFLESICSRDNVVLLEGNHEIHLRAYLNNYDLGYGKEFKTNTRKELIEKQTGNTTIKKVIQSLKTSFLFTYNNTEYVCTHGGVLPTTIKLLTHDEKIRGVGGYSFNIDEKWEELSSTQVQFHGHRNQFKVNPNQYKRSFNLESKVDSGGELRVATINEQGVTVKEYENKYISGDKNTKLKNRLEMKEYLDTNTKKGLNGKQRAYIHKTTVEGAEINYIVFGARYINKGYKTSETPTKAVRGLFLGRDNTIILRGYDKFYNIGENESVGDTLQSLEYPLVGYKKENGYLGLVSYNTVLDSFIFGTKKTITNISDYKKRQSRENSSRRYKYVDELIRLFNLTFNKEQQNVLKNYLILNNKTLSFEVISYQDKHITKEDKESLVLLDSIKNQLEFKKSKYKQLVSLRNKLSELNTESNKLELRLKEKALSIKSKEQLEGYLRKDANYMIVKHEGFVLEDSKCNIVKYKSVYYAYWKCVRNSLLNSLSKKTEEGGRMSIQSNIDSFKETLNLGEDSNTHNYIESTWESISEIYNRLLEQDTQFKYTNLVEKQELDIPSLVDYIEGTIKQESGE